MGKPVEVRVLSRALFWDERGHFSDGRALSGGDGAFIVGSIVSGITAFPLLH
jgi:hypothetical protein